MPSSRKWCHKIFHHFLKDPLNKSPNSLFKVIYTGRTCFPIRSVWRSPTGSILVLHDQASERARWCSRYDRQACLQVSPSELAWECGPYGQLLPPVRTVALQANEGATHFAEIFPGWLRNDPVCHSAFTEKQRNWWSVKKIVVLWGRVPCGLHCISEEPTAAILRVKYNSVLFIYIDGARSNTHQIYNSVRTSCRENPRTFLWSARRQMQWENWKFVISEQSFRLMHRYKS
jgi:hypothetical protein